MIKCRFGWFLPAQVLMLALPLIAQQPRQSEIAAAAQTYGYNLAEGNWTYSQASCHSMPGWIMFHYRRGYVGGAESNFTAIVPRSFGHVRIVPVLYHGATPFVPAPSNPRNFALFNSLAVPVGTSGPNPENRWFERASCYAEMTGGNDFRVASGAGPQVAGQPSATVSLTVQDKTARVLFAERDSSHSYRVWNLLFNREGRIKFAQTQEQSVYASRVARARVPRASPETEGPKNAAVPVSPTATLESARESANRPAQISTSQPQQRASIEAEQRALLAAPVAVDSSGSGNGSQSAGSTTAGAEPSQPGWKLILNPPQPPSKFIPNASAPTGTTVPNPPSDPQ